MIRYVVFDLGGVVFRFDPQRRLDLMSAASPLSRLEIEAALWGSGLSEDADRGLYDARELAAEARSRARLAMDYGQIREAWVSAFEPDPAVEAILAAVRPNLRLASFSNNGELIRFGLEAAWPGVLRRFERTLWSYQAGALKPDREAFRYVERRLGAAPGEICFVDDSEHNVEGARRAGWDAVPFTQAEALAAALGDRGLLADA